MVELDSRTAQLLSENREARVSVEPCTGGWRVRPSEVVGTFQVGETRFVIQPKIPISNVLALLDVDLGSFRISRQTFEYDSAPDLLIGLIRLFADGLDTALSQGLRHDYVQRTESLNSIRGRVEFARLARMPGAEIPTPCRFDEYTADVRVNQLLLSAIEIAVRVPGVPPADIVRMRRHLAAFHEVAHHQGPVDWVRAWVPNRMETHYAPAVRPAALIVENLTATLAAGRSTGPSFMVDMNRLVEKFIEVRIGRYLDSGSGLESQAARWLDVEESISYRPDLVVTRNGAPVAVADVKYKALSELKDIDNADLYQAHTYAQALGLDKAMIICCIADGRPLPRQRTTISRTGIEIELWAIDLSVPVLELESQLLELAHFLCRP